MRSGSTLILSLTPHIPQSDSQLATLLFLKLIARSGLIRAFGVSAFVENRTKINRGMNMFCPNCGANNNKRQNYCRFCGLNLQDTAKSLITQLVFGEDSNLLKTLSSVKRIVDFASTALIGVVVIGVVAYLFSEPDFGKDLMKISLGVFFLLKIIQEIIGYFQRRERSKAGTSKFEQNTIEQSESKETARFLEEKSFEPMTSVVENSTELLPLENKARKFE